MNSSAKFLPSIYQARPCALQRPTRTMCWLDAASVMRCQPVKNSVVRSALALQAATLPQRLMHQEIHAASCPAPSLDDASYLIEPPMSALGQKQTFALKSAMSALSPRADMCGARCYVSYGPIADIQPIPCNYSVRFSLPMALQ